MSITLVSSPVAIGDASTLATSTTLLPMAAERLEISFADLLKNQLTELKPPAGTTIAVLKEPQEQRKLPAQSKQEQGLLDEMYASRDPMSLDLASIPYPSQSAATVPTSSGKGDIDSELTQKPGLDTSILPTPTESPQTTPLVIEQPSHILQADKVSSQNSAPLSRSIEPALSAPTHARLSSLSNEKANPPYISSNSNTESGADNAFSSRFIMELSNTIANKQTAQFPVVESASGFSPSISTVSTPQAEAAILAGNTSSSNPQAGEMLTIAPGNSTPPNLQTVHTAPPGVNTPLHDTRWAQNFGEQIVWIAKNDQQTAQISISPAQLGPVQITLNMNGEQANISFASPHAEVRKAIEDAIPNLREMLSSAGISLGQSNVGAQLPQQQRDNNSLFANGNRSSGENAILPADPDTGSPPRGLPMQRGRGMVDLFA